jgi:hypothetical protein
VNEHILAVFSLNEAITLGRIKPLYSTFFLHSSNPFLALLARAIRRWRKLRFARAA